MILDVVSCEERDLINSISKLIERVYSIPLDLRINEADRFLGFYGFELRRQSGSHRIYKNKQGIMINIQGPIVKPYQIEQILKAVERGQ